MSDVMADDDTGQRQMLQLDARRREMLELMGVRLWWPEPKAVPQTPVAPKAEPAAPVQRQAEVPAEPPVAREAAAPARTAPVAPTPAPTRAPAAQGRAAEGLLADAPRLLFGGPAAVGGWLVLADVPPDMLGGYGDPLAGDEGRLLANMLRALRLDGGEVPVHLVRVHRGSAQPGEGMPRPLEELVAQQCSPLAPRVVLALGPLAAQAMLQRAGPIGKLRGEAQTVPDGPMAGTPALASYPLAYLLRNGPEKAKAWADLCQAAALAAAPR